MSDDEQGDERPGLMGRIKGAFSSDDDEADGHQGEGDEAQDESSAESRPDMGPTDEQRTNPPSAGSRTEVVRNALRAFVDGDADGFLGPLGDDVEWVGPVGRHAPGAGTHRGRDAVQEEFLGAVGEHFEGLGFRPATYLEGLEEDLVVVIGVFEGSGAQGEVNAPAVLNWTFVEERVVRVEVFTDSEHFRRAVEGEEQSDDEDEGADADQQEGEGENGDHESSGDGGEADSGQDNGQEDGTRGETQGSGDDRAQGGGEADAQGSGGAEAQGSGEPEAQGSREPEAQGSREDTGQGEASRESGQGDAGQGRLRSATQHEEGGQDDETRASEPNDEGSTTQRG